MPSAVGRYELVRAIGRGGMAEVFLARRRGAAGIAKRLVVKRMRQELLSDPRLAELFLREARVATQLSHKNIVTVFDVGRDPEGLFLAMEYVEGPDLAAAMAGARERGLRFDPLIAAHIASEVAAGLDHAHRARDERGAALGLVHRDITPRNILLSLDGEVKVTDFGVAVLGGEAADERRGTLPYMSPEQARSEAVDPRADLFSLGLVLFELLAERRAYDERDRDALLALARAGEVPATPSDAPAELTRIVARATAASRDDRFASARDMQRELAAWAVNERGRRGQTDPLEHALASFLASAVPGWTEQGDDASGRAAGVAGTGTLRLVAETAGDNADAESAREGRIESTEPTRRSRRPAALVGGAALALIAAAALLATTRSPQPDEPAVEAVPAAREANARGRAATIEPRPETRSAPEHPGAPTPHPGTVGPPSAAEPSGQARPDRAEPAPRPPDRAAAGASSGPRRSSAAPRTRARRTGTLEINAVPWAYVSIDGGPEVETPIRGRVLSAGRHRIVIRNPVLEKQRELAVNIAPGETARYVVDLNR